MAERSRYESDECVPDVPEICAPYARYRLRSHLEHDLDHEPRLYPATQRLFSEQSGVTRSDPRSRPRTRPGWHYRERNQPRAVWHGNEPNTDAGPASERAVSGQHSGRALGKSGGNRRARELLMLGGRGLYYRNGHSDRRRLVCSLNRGFIAALPGASFHFSFFVTYLLTSIA